MQDRDHDCRTVRTLNLSGKSISVIGATSFLGGALMRIFKGYFAYLQGIGHSQAEIYGYSKLDMTQEADVRLFFKENVIPDIVVYVSGEANADKAEIDRERTYALHVEAIRYLHECCPKVKLVYISTEYVFDGNHPPYAPTSTAEPLNYYGQTKLRGERLSLELFQDSIVLRLGALYGYNEARDRPTTLSRILDLIEQNKPIRVDRRQIKYPILLDDVADILLKLLRRDAQGIFQLNGTKGYTKVEMAKIAVLVWNEMKNKSYNSTIDGFEDTKGCPKPLNTRMLNTDTPRSFEDGLRYMIKRRMKDKHRLGAAHG